MAVSGWLRWREGEEKEFRALEEQFSWLLRFPRMMARLGVEDCRSAAKQLITSGNEERKRIAEKMNASNKQGTF